MTDDPRALARAGGPATSAEAAERVAGELEDLRARAAAAVSAWPGSTARELSEVLGDRDPRTINRRLGEAERLGMVERGEPRPCTITGRRCATWWLPGDEAR